MKKYTGYLLVGLVSSMTTMGGFYLMNENGSNPFITNASHQKNGDFEFVDYKGNYNYDAPNFVQASNKAVHTVVSIKNYSNQRQQQQQQMFDPFDFFFGQPEQQQRTDISRRDPPAIHCCLRGDAIKGPAGAVDGQGKAKYPGRERMAAGCGRRRGRRGAFLRFHSLRSLPRPTACQRLLPSLSSSAYRLPSQAPT